MVNGTPVPHGYKVQEGDSVTIDGKRVSPVVHRYFALNKPIGYTCTTTDPHAEKRALDLLPSSLGRLFTVGRLDRNSHGLLLITNDGDFAERLTHPRYGVEKEFVATIIPPFRQEDAARITAGIEDAGEMLIVRSVREKHTYQGKSVLSLIMKEGKKREIRRIFSALRYHLLDLERVRIGTLTITGIPLGGYRTLTRNEVENLLAASSPTPNPMHYPACSLTAHNQDKRQKHGYTSQHKHK